MSNDSNSNPNDELDRALRRLASNTHPRADFTARLRGELQNAPAPRRRFGFHLFRPWIAQGALVALLVGLALLAGGLTRGLLPDLPAAQVGRPVPGQILPGQVLPGQPTETGVSSLAGLPAGALARLGRGMILSLDSAPDGRLAVGTTAGLCLYGQGLMPDWCRWTSSGVQEVRFDPSGSVLALRYNGAPVVEIWDAGTGQVRAQREFGAQAESFRLPGGVNLFSFESGLAWEPSNSPSATMRLAVAGADGSLALWDWQNDAIAWGPLALPAPASDLDWAVNASGQSILAAATRAQVLLIDGATGEVRYSSAENSLSTNVALSSDGRLLAASVPEGAVLVNLDGWQPAGTSRSLPVTVHAIRLAFSPDQALLGLLDLDRAVIVDLSDGIADRSAAASSITPLAWTMDGARLFYAAPDGSLAYLNGTENVIPTGHAIPSGFLAWSGDQQIIAASDDYIYTWDVTGAQSTAGLGEIRHVTLAGSDALKAVGLSPDGSRAGFLDRTNRYIGLYDVPANSALPGINTERPMLAAAMHPDGQHMAVVTDDGLIMHVRIESDAVDQRDINAAPGITQVDALAYQPGGDLIAMSYVAGESGPKMALWNTTTAGLHAELPINESVTQIVWSADGRLVAALHGYRITIWDVQTAGQVAALAMPAGQDTWFTTAAFSPDGKSLAAAARDVIVYDLAGQSPPRIYSGHAGSVTALAFRPDGLALASTSLDSTIIVWDLGSAPYVPEQDRPTPTPFPSDFVPTLAPTATELFPTVTVTPTIDPGSGDLANYDLTAGTFASPTGAWTVEVLRGEWTERAPREEDYNRITTYHIDGSARWTYEYWSPHGLGEGYPGNFTWTKGEDFLYFYETGYGDGCGGAFQSALRRMDLSTGAVEPVTLGDPNRDGWVGQLALSPDASLAATYDGLPIFQLQGEPGIVITHLITKQQREFNFPAPDTTLMWGPLKPHWSPDGSRVAFTLQWPYPPCGETEYTTQTYLVDLVTGEIRPLDLPEMVTVTEWEADARALVLSQQGVAGDWLYDLATGTLTPRGR